MKENDNALQCENASKTKQQENPKVFHSIGVNVPGIHRSENVTLLNKDNLS